MQIIDIIRTFSNADPYDEVIVTDGEKEYTADHLRIDNGFAEMHIEVKKGEKRMSNTNDLYYDDNDAIAFIKKETGLDEVIIKTVLGSEFRYMQSVGIIEEEIDYER